MKFYTLNPDYETAERCGASGTFQVGSLIDEKGQDVTAKLRVDQGRHYTSVAELERDVAAVLHQKVEIQID